MELGVGEALISFLDDDGIPQPVQRTSVICPQSLMAAADAQTKNAVRASDGMSKYDTAVDNDSAYEELEKTKAVEEEQAKLQAEREALEKEKEAFEKQKQKEAEAAEKQKQKEAENEAAKREKAAERRKNQIERQIISTGGQILKRGLMNTLFGRK